MSKSLEECVEQMREARWKGWQRLAKQLKHHHILSVELLRTRQDETVVVFTVSTKRGPVQYVLKGDANGGRPIALVSDCDGRLVPQKPGAHRPQEARSHEAASLQDDAPSVWQQGGELLRAGVELIASLAAEDDAVEASGIAMGVPPPKESPSPGIVALGTVLLETTFNLGEQVPVE